MWIYLCQKLPVKNSPPAMSIFWSTAWPSEKYLAELKTLQDKATKEGCSIYELNTAQDNIHALQEWQESRKIHYQGEDIRVFPHEFSKPKEKDLLLYTMGDDIEGPSHTLVTETVAEDSLLKDIMDGEQRLIYDAALLDGCNPAQALMTGLGKDITIPDVKIPAIGWYRVKPEYGLMFYSAKDLNLTEEEKLEFGIEED